MRILFLHLSDLHIKDSSKVDTVKIDKVIQSVLKYRNIIDEVVIVLSGDVAWSGGINEYKVACRLIHILRKRIGNELNKYINIKIVPGNHDIIMSKLNRNSSDIIDYFKNNTAKEMYYNELKSMSAFLRFANHYKCFISNKVCDKGIIDFSEKYGCRIQFNLINTAPFSTLKADSKELHFLPDNELSSLYRDDSSDICITIMHHSTEWFYWEKKEELENIIYHHSDFVFQGHEHILHSSTINMDNKTNIIIFKGGEFSVDDSMASQYSIIVFDTETREVNEDKYTWDYKTPIFVSEPIFKNKKVLVKSSSFQINEEFLVDFNKDKLGFCESFTDYYVFPKLYYSYTRESKYKLDIDESYFFNILKNKKIIEIRAGKSAGKTAFLKYIFNVCQEYGYISLYIGAEEYTSFKVDTIVERLFNDQYSKYDLERFLQTSNEKKILLIDDADKLANNKLLNIIFEKIFEHVDHIIYSSDNSFNLNIIEAAKEEIDKDNVLQLNLAVFYKEKRKQLVTNICKTAKLKDSEIEIIINSIDNLVQRQSGLFSLSPEFIIVYLKYFMSFDHQKNKQDDVFNKVFETNINNAIISATSKSNVEIYYSLLCEIAFTMHFSKKEIIHDTELNSIIEAFNIKHKKKINAAVFIDEIIKSNIIIKTKDTIAYKFFSNNYLAYFVAIKLSRNLEKNPSNTDHLKYVVKNICFGINDIILLFLSYIRSNVNFVYYFINEVKLILNEVEELDFDKDNIPLLKSFSSSNVKMPGNKEKEEMEKIEEQQEIVTYNGTLKYKKIYDYDEKEADKGGNLIIRAKKCIEIISRSLINLNGVLEAEEIDKIVKCMYIMPNKLMFYFLEPYSINCDIIVDELKSYVCKTKLIENPDEKEIKQILSTVLTAFVLSMYDDVAYYGSDINTIESLLEYEEYNSNITIQKLMMCEATYNSKDFIKKAIDVFEENNDPFTRKLIKLIVRKHLLTHDFIRHDDLDRLSSKIFCGEKKEVLLLSSQQNK